MRNGDVRLHYVVAGRGEPVVFLHGFPDFWYSWREQIPAVVDAGYRAVAPDLRGYNLSDKPAGIGRYGIEELVGDVGAILEECAGPVTLVGHDWGGVVAWLTAERRPQQVRRIVIVNAPRADRYVRELLKPTQLLKSWYVAFFQVPWLPERLMRVVGAGPAKRLLFGAATREDDESVRAAATRYEEAFPNARSFHAPIDYYRAAARPRRSFVSAPAHVEQPVLVIWGAKDPALNRRLADPGAGVRRIRIEVIEDAGHWVHIQRPAQVNRLLIDFLHAGQ